MQIRRNEAAQEAILDATFRLLSNPGTEAVTIEAIAAEAGVGRQTIYRWWPSKGAVVADALARHAQVVVPERDTGSYAKDLAAFLIDSFAGLRQEGYADRIRRLSPKRSATSTSRQSSRTSPRACGWRCAPCWNAARLPGNSRSTQTLTCWWTWPTGRADYRLLIGHAPLDEEAARSLAAELTRPAR